MNNDFASRMGGDLSSGESAICQRSQDRLTWPRDRARGFGNNIISPFGILRERTPQLLHGQTARIKSVYDSSSLCHMDNFVESHYNCQIMALHCRNGELNDSQERREHEPDYVVSSNRHRRHISRQSLRVGMPRRL